MAEIEVQRKRSGGWSWVLGIGVVILAVLILAGVWNDGDDDIDAVNTGPVAAVPAPDTAPTTGATEPAAPAAVAAFLTFADAPAASAGRAHELAADGIRRLALAMNALIDEKNVSGTSVQERLRAFQAHADRIQADPQGMQHAEQVSAAFTGAADLMSAVQQERWPQASTLQDQIAAVREAATSVAGGQPLLDQTDAVNAFFDHAAIVLRSMSEQG